MCSKSYRSFLNVSISDSSKKSWAYYCCCFGCCKRKSSKKGAHHSIPTQLPEPRTQIETFDFTSAYRRKSKPTEPNEMSTSFMTNVLNSERPSDLDKKAAMSSPPDSPFYIRLEGAQEAASGLQRLSGKQHKTIDILEEATRL